jgi:integrase/recombinase XerD
MTSTTQSISPLRQRMIEDMTMRKLEFKTQTAYIRAVRKLADYLGHSPAKATAEQLRGFQLSMVEKCVSNTTINGTITGLHFFFRYTLNRSDLSRILRTVPKLQKLPDILSKEEVKRLIDATRHIKYKTALSVAYGAGLRVSEVVGLKMTDIDSERMVLRIQQAKGNKDRLAMLSTDLLTLLRQWWQYGRKHNLLLEGGWVFPGQQRVNHLSTRQLSRACQSAIYDAGLTKRASMHTLRHSFATHLLEARVDIRIIQALLGHAKLETTVLYTQVATKLMREVVSPLDALATIEDDET